MPSNSSESTRLRNILAAILVLSIVVHLVALVLGSTVLAEWRWPHHAVHSSMEMLGSVIAIWCAWMLLIMERRSGGTNFNIYISGALVGMGLLDGFHALCHAGNNFVWLHSVATFVGGTLFVLVWVPKSLWSPPPWWPVAVAILITLLAAGSFAMPSVVPVMVQEGVFTGAATLLNVVGGILMLAAAAKLIWSHLETLNNDDLLFCLHCSLFGMAAIMFEQSQLWDFPWWGWHLLRIAAYGVAMYFIQINNSEYVLGRMLADRARFTAAEERMRLVVEASSSGMVMADDSGTILLVNARMETTFGYSRDEMLGQPIELLLPGEIHEQHIRDRTEFMRNPRVYEMGAGRDVFGLHKAGYRVPVAVALNPIELDSRVCVLATVVNVTARKEAERAIRQANDDLERSNDELRQFASVASHDLQEPLRKVSSFCQLLNDEYGDKIDGDGKEYMKYVVDGTTRMRALIQDLLAYSRVESQGAPLEKVDVNEVLQNSLHGLAGAIEDSGAVITHDELPVVQADLGQLTQLFQNLIGNGIKYCESSPPEIHIGVESKGHEWQFSVSDNGIGIDPKFHDRIFGIFKRLHGRGEYSGTGIGLAICKRIVDRLAGKLWIESEEGQGSTFYFTVPKDASPESKEIWR